MTEKPGKPAPQEGEVTLIGTGGYGETIVIHLGDGQWAIVDSCIDPHTDMPQGLEYLQQIGVDCAKDVRLVICTHWHNDHILGISKLLEECKSAKLSFSKAHDTEKFLRFIAFDYEKGVLEKANSATFEFNKCIEIIKERGKPVVVALENKPLFTHHLVTGGVCQVIALSPSDYTMEKFDHEIGTLITEYGSPSKKISINTPNAKSVAVFLKLGPHRAILGADLEVSADPREGWVNILDNSQIIDQKASLFKISHHASENGYHERIFTQLLVTNPVSNLTPWNRGQGLPEPEMLKKYCGLSDQVYMTNPHTSKKAKERDKQMEKFIKQLNRKLEEVKYRKGIIRCRIDLKNADALWEVLLLENSFHVNPVLGK